MTVRPIYFSTFTTYGSWLPGDSRGSFVDDRLDGPGLKRSRPHLESVSRARLKHDPVVLRHQARAITHQTIEKHSRFRGWHILALNVRTNHVHVVFQPDRPVDRAVGELKAWASRELVARGVIAAGLTIWTRGSSNRYLHTPESVQDAVAYTLNQS